MYRFNIENQLLAQRTGGDVQYIVLQPLGGQQQGYYKSGLPPVSFKIPRVFLAHTQRKYGGKEGRQCELCESLSAQRATTTETSEKGTVLTVSCSSDTSSGSCCHLPVASGTAARLQPALQQVTKCTGDVYVTLAPFILLIWFCSRIYRRQFLSVFKPSMKDSMSKFCLEVVVGLMSFSFPVSLCTDQDSSILLYFHLNLTRKSDLFLVCSTVIFPILYTIVYRIRTYLYLASFECLI